MELFRLFVTLILVLSICGLAALISFILYAIFYFFNKIRVSDAKLVKQTQAVKDVLSNLPASHIICFGDLCEAKKTVASRKREDEAQRIAQKQRQLIR